MNEELITKIECQRAFFASGATLDWQYRRAHLKRLYHSIESHRADIDSALFADLHKSPFESFACETGMVLTELSHQIKLCRTMRRPQRVARSIFTINGRSRILYEPYGVTLIVSPWNYPFHLALLPLCGAIAAGNVVILKLSPDASATNAIVRTIVEECFAPNYVLVVEGHRETNTLLFDQRWNHIFLTGSPDLGRIAMASAARNLTPVTLELGGKSPCIVDSDADIEMSAKRIVYGKLINAGQTCIAPDYLLVHQSVKKPLMEAMQRYIAKFYGPDTRLSSQYPRIVNDKAMERLVHAMQQGTVIFGGGYDLAERFIEPTCIDNLPPDAELLTREIFGPIFPVLTFESIDEVVQYVNSREKPLAFYYFTRSRKRARFLLSHTTSGGACVNDTLMHITNPHMPFGGVENSGLGGYHGKYSYSTFSHQRSVFSSSLCFDFWFKYPPFKDFWSQAIRKLMR